MSPNSAHRINAAYVLIGLNLILTMTLIVTLVYVSDLRSKVEATNAQSRQACARGNLVRSQVNTNSSILQSSLAQAAQIWESTASMAEARGDTAAARIDRDAAAGYRALTTSFTPLHLPDCESLYP